MRRNSIPRLILACSFSIASLMGTHALTDFYWETPAPFVSGSARYPVSASNGDASVIAWQESVRTSEDGGQARISLAFKRSGSPWRVIRNAAGPYAFSGGEPPIASVAVDRDDRVLLAVSANPGSTDIFLSSDDGETFSISTIGSTATAEGGGVAPRIFARADGGYLLFLTRGAGQSLSIFYARSDDGVEWSPFEPFVTEEGLLLNFLPTHAAAGDTDYVVFQSLSGSIRPTYQLYLKTSSDGGRTWTAARSVTGFRDPFAQGTAPEGFDNQRPYLATVGTSVYLTWERRVGQLAPQVYVAELEAAGLRGEVDRVTTPGPSCNNPIVVDYRGEPLVVWYDNRRGQNRVYLAQRDGLFWQESDLSGSRIESLFARPVADADGLFVFWQAAVGGTERLYLIEPDRRVAAPTLIAGNFTPGVRTRRDAVRISWRAPEDSSGIAAYSYVWSMNPQARPPRERMVLSTTTAVDRIATEDGSWYLAVIAEDYAGNWSEPSRIEFVRDTTAPGRVNIVLPPLDERGFLDSNTFSIEWNPPPASDLAGFSWELEYLAPLEYVPVLERRAGGALPAGAAFETLLAAAFPVAAPLRRDLGLSTSASFTNRDDGLWRFSVAAIDEVGNIGERVSRYFRTDKYVPYTYVTFAQAAVDDFGVLSLSLIGRGFAVGGLVNRVFLDQDGRPPYDREFTLVAGEFRVDDDRRISGLRVEDLAEGVYRVGVVHPTRGLHLTAPLVNVDATGTVKFGDFSREWRPSWTSAVRPRFSVDAVLLVFGAVLVFGLFGALVSIRGIGGVLQEGAQIRIEVAALLSGDLMPSEKKKIVSSVKKRGGGLGLKLAAFTTVLVVAVVILVSVPLSVFMTNTQEETLVRGLKDRSRVLLESLASGARAYLPSRNVLELGFLPAQTAAVPEARYATITGYGLEATTFTDHVWATNDPAIGEKIDTAEFTAGISRLEDPLSPRIDAIAEELNERARVEVGDLSTAIADLTQEGLRLALRTDAESIRRRDDIQATTRELETRLNERLAAIAANIGAEPAFDEDRLPPDARTFIFFKPVMYRQGSEDVYFRGLIRLEVAIDSIEDAMAMGRRDLIRITGTVALLAVAIGVFGALLLASLIVRPLRRLVSHVATIRDTEDKAKLAGHDIHVKSRDEIEILGDTINDMTHGLVKAAAASADLTVGKDVQKMFIPLDTDASGRKLTSGRTDTPLAEFFGYYEGAKGVSGDYFDYLKLAEPYYAIIKCDVAGKGVPAALIMIEVATLFLSYFKNWRPNAEGMRLEKLVYQINDFLEARGFKGRFAAFTLCLFNAQSGELRFCNAGDNLVHIYDAAERRMKLLTLPETPTAGVFPNDLIEMKGGYAVQTLRLNRDDILLLYSDGIEEAKRKFRDAQLRELLYWKSSDDFKPASEEADHIDNPGAAAEKGIPDEEFSPERVQDVINAALARDRYELKKIHNPDPDERFSFDFTQCAGSVEDAIMAMVSVEKVFRMYRDPKAGEDSRVLVDKKIDEFLRLHFDQYRNYAARMKEHGELSEYVYYTGIKEDEQYDDLTILGIRKK